MTYVVTMKRATGIVGIVAAFAALAGCSGGDDLEAPSDAVTETAATTEALAPPTATSATDSATTIPATTEAVATTPAPTTEAPSSTTTTTTTTTTTLPPTTTTTLPEMQLIRSGTYAVPGQMSPGFYRVVGYWALLDDNLEIIDNDGVYESGFGLLNVVEGAGVAFVEISGEAVRADDPAAPPSIDPLVGGLTKGTYLVGFDVQPGRYQVSDPDYAYGACLTPEQNGAWDIVNNDGNAGNIIIDIDGSCLAFQFSGTLEKIG